LKLDQSLFWLDFEWLDRWLSEDAGMFLRNDTILRHCHNASMFGVLIGSVQFVSAGPFGCGGQSAHQSREGTCGRERC